MNVTYLRNVKKEGLILWVTMLLTVRGKEHFLIMWCDRVGGAFTDSKKHFLFPWCQKHWPTSTLRANDHL